MSTIRVWMGCHRMYSQPHLFGCVWKRNNYCLWLMAKVEVNGQPRCFKLGLQKSTRGPNDWTCLMGSHLFWGPNLEKRTYLAVICNNYVYVCNWLFWYTYIYIHIHVLYFNVINHIHMFVNLTHLMWLMSSWFLSSRDQRSGESVDYRKLTPIMGTQPKDKLPRTLQHF